MGVERLLVFLVYDDEAEAERQLARRGLVRNDADVVDAGDLSACLERLDPYAYLPSWVPVWLWHARLLPLARFLKRRLGYWGRIEWQDALYRRGKAAFAGVDLVLAVAGAVCASTSTRTGHTSVAMSEGERRLLRWFPERGLTSRRALV